MTAVGDLVRYRDRLYRVDAIRPIQPVRELMLCEHGKRYPSTEWAAESKVRPVSEAEDRRLRPGKYRKEDTGQ